MLENIFGSRTRVKLLKLFLIHPERSFFVRELARKTGEEINSIRRELNNLEELGLIKVENEAGFNKGSVRRQGQTKKEKRKFYSVNTNFLLYNEFKNLILKSRFLLEKSLVKEINNLGKVKLLVLSGVFVDDKKAKTDFLIVGNIDREKLKLLIGKLEKNFDQEIRYTVMTTQEFNYRNRITDKFLFEMLEGRKIIVIDNLDSQRFLH